MIFCSTVLCAMKGVATNARMNTNKTLRGIHHREHKDHKEKMKYSHKKAQKPQNCATVMAFICLSRGLDNQMHAMYAF